MRARPQLAARELDGDSWKRPDLLLAPVASVLNGVGRFSEHGGGCWPGPPGRSVCGPARSVKGAFGVADAMRFAHPGRPEPALVLAGYRAAPPLWRLSAGQPSSGWGISASNSAVGPSRGWPFSKSPIKLEGFYLDPQQVAVFTNEIRAIATAGDIDDALLVLRDLRDEPTHRQQPAAQQDPHRPYDRQHLHLHSPRLICGPGRG